MKSKIFLCLLLIVAILAFGACGNKDNAAGKMEHAVDDVADGIDDAKPNDLVAVVSYYGLAWIFLIHLLQLTG